MEGEGKAILSAGTVLLKSLAMGADQGVIADQVSSLNQLLRAQPMDSRLQEQLGKVSMEVTYTRMRLFFGRQFCFC